METVLGVAEELRALYPRLIDGDMGVVAAFASRATVDSPLGGRQQPAEFVSDAHAWLERHKARVEDVHSVITAERVIHELLLYVLVDAIDRELPVMLVADAEDGHIRDLRIYHSTWPLTRKHAVRPPLMQYDLTRRPPEPVGTYHEALSEGSAAKADSVFEADGCVREPSGGEWVYCGVKRTEWYRDILAEGPIVLHLGTISDDGETVVHEYMVDRWGAESLTPQAGAAAYQRGPAEKLIAARIYDDVQPPASLGEV